LNLHKLYGNFRRLPNRRPVTPRTCTGLRDLNHKKGRKVRFDHGKRPESGAFVKYC